MKTKTLKSQDKDSETKTETSGDKAILPKTSCIAGEPLTKLDEAGAASILNYNLPQATTYDVLYFIQLDISYDLFEDAELKAPDDNYWQLFKSQKLDITNLLIGKEFTNIADLQKVVQRLSSKSILYTKGGSLVQASTENIAAYLENGYRPVTYELPSGRDYLRFVKEPEEPTPSIYIVFHMKMASYLANYGAGSTVSTFSLLPGETTTISIRNYEHNEETASTSQSILDSYSEEVKDEFQDTITTETNLSSSVQEVDTNSMSASLTATASGKLSIFGEGVSGGTTTTGSLSSVNTTTEALNYSSKILTNSLDTHTQTVDTQRQIEVNTETTSTSTVETEKTITRTLSNINKSRVLNFVFRQLLQEYITLIYLHDVTFFYSNGYSESETKGTLGTLRAFLSDVLKNEDDINKVENTIYEYLCNVTDYTGTKVPLIELVKEETSNCIHPAQGRKVSYVRTRPNLQQTYEGKTIKGIILDVSSRILRTPSVIVDALLGKGEALDCYNQHLQEAAYTAAHLENDKTQQMIDLINGITDPVEKAKLYKKVFTDCCDVPQSCCCCGSQAATSGDTK